MNLTVNPYSNFSNSNKVNFQANLDISKIKFGSYPRNWSKKHWKQVADFFEKATADCPDHTFILNQISTDIIDFVCACGKFKSSVAGTLKFNSKKDRFITMSAEEKAGVLEKLFRMKKLNDELKVADDKYLALKLATELGTVTLNNGYSLYQHILPKQALK